MVLDPLRRRLLPALLLLLTVGCASPYEDRFESINRPIRSFNDTVDRAVTKPLAKGYVAVVPDFAQNGIANFFVNLRYPVVP